MLYAYLGPETVLPATSALAAAVGFLLMFGRGVGRVSWLVACKLGRTLGLGRRPGRVAAKSPSMGHPIPRPHLAQRSATAESVGVGRGAS